jgi:hypothetical protein
MGWVVNTTPQPLYPPGKETQYPLYRRLGESQSRSGLVRKNSPPSGFDIRTVQPVASLYTDWAIPVHPIHGFIHLVVWLTTCPKPLPKPALHIVRSRASCFRCEYPVLSLRSSSSFLRLLPQLPVTSIPPFICPSIICCRRHFLRKMWPIQLAFRLLISCRIFLCSLTLSNTSSFHGYWEWNSRGTKFTTHLHLNPWFRMSEPANPLPYTPSWRGQGQFTILPDGKHTELLAQR